MTYVFSGTYTVHCTVYVPENTSIAQLYMDTSSFRRLHPFPSNNPFIDFYTKLDLQSLFVLHTD
jgi:hypothetical protein